MAKINPKTADEKVEMQGFGGIRQCALLSDVGASEMRNFRIRADGSLEKRNGYSAVMNLSSAVRAVWEGNGLFFGVSGYAVYRKDSEESSPHAVYYLPTSSGRAYFCEYDGNLFLFDGEDIYRYQPNTGSFMQSNGYAPLYGKNWHPTQMGEVNEELNLLCPRIRIRYLNSVGSTQFVLPYTTRQINRMTINGEQITNYSFTPQTNTFTIPATLAYGVLEVAVTISSVFSQRSALARAKCPCHFYNFKHEDLFLYGSGYKVYHTEHIGADQLNDSLLIYPDSDTLYFPANGIFYIGDSSHPVTAMCQRGDRLIAFNSSSAWGIARDEDDILYAYGIEGCPGCNSFGGLAPCGDSPVIVRPDGVFRVSFAAGEPTACSMKCLSAEVRELFSDELLQNGILSWLPDRDELWLRDPNETSDGLVWVYHFGRREWSQFDHIPANLFFLTSENVPGFGTENGLVALLDSSVNTDNGTPISAYYQSHFLSLEHPENKKRAWRVVLSADPGPVYGQTLTVETDRASKTFRIPESDPGTPVLLDHRSMNGRFRFLRFRINSPGSARPRFYRVSVLAAD